MWAMILSLLWVLRMFWRNWRTPQPIAKIVSTQFLSAWTLLLLTSLVLQDSGFEDSFGTCLLPLAPLGFRCAESLEEVLLAIRMVVLLDVARPFLLKVLLAIRRIA